MTDSAYKAAAAFRAALMNEDLEVRDQIGVELDEFQYLLRFGWQAVPPLIAMLDDEDDYVRAVASEALDRFAGDSRVVEPLIAALGDPCPDVRASAACPLAETGHAKALDALIAAATDPEANVRFQAIQALRDFKSSRRAADAVAVVMRTDSDTKNRLDAAKFLEAMGAFSELKWALDNGLDMEKQTIARALGEVGGDGAFEHLVLLLRSGGDKDEQAELLAFASELWGATSGNLNGLMSCMEGNDAYDQREAALALGQLGDSRAIPYLQAALENPHFHVVTAAATALCALDRESGVSALIELLQSPDQRMLKWPGPLGFGAARDARITDRLIEMLASDDAALRRFAGRELAEAGDVRAEGPLREAVAQGDAWATKALRSLGCVGPIDGLAVLISSDDPRQALSAARAMSYFPDPRAVDALLGRVDSEEWGLAEAAIKALGAIGDPRAASAVTRIARSAADAGVRRYACWALSRLDCREARQALLDVMDAGDITAASGTYAYYISLGRDGSEQFLVDVLTCHGHKAAAADFAKCGNATLAAAGQVWLEDHPYLDYRDYEPWGEPSGVRWGGVR